MAEIKDWRNLINENVSTPPDGAPENMDRSDVNNVIRENMAVLRRQWEQTEWRDLTEGNTVAFVSVTQFQIQNFDATLLYRVGTKVRMGVSGTYSYGFVSVVAFATHTTVTIAPFANGTTAVPAGINSAEAFYLGAGEAGVGLGEAAFSTSVGGAHFELPLGDTIDDIQTAITNAEGNGRIVVLPDGDVQFAAAGSNSTKITINGPVTIWGRGVRRTRFTQVNSRNLDMFDIPDDASDITMSGFAIDGNATNQTAGNGMVVGNNVHRLRVDDIEIKNIKGHGFRAEASSVSPTTQGYENWRISNLTVDTCGKDCFRIQEPNDNTNKGIFIDNMYLAAPGATGLTDNGAYNAFVLFGSGTVNNLDIDLRDSTSSTVLRGIIHARTVGHTKDKGCQISNFEIVGTGANQHGLRAAGKSGSFSNGYIDLIDTTGKLSRCIDIDGNAAPDDANSNKFANIECVGGDHSSISNDSTDNEFVNVTFRDSFNDGVVVSGPRTSFNACRFTSQRKSGIAMASGAADMLVAGCTFRGNPEKGINTASGVDRMVVTGSNFELNERQGINILSGTTNSHIAGNKFYGIESLDNGIVDSGTDTSINGNRFKSLVQGVDLDSATRPIVSNNDFDDCTNGVILDAGTTDAVIKGNSFVSCTTNITDSSSVTPTIIDNTPTTAGTQSRMVYIEGVGQFLGGTFTVTGMGDVAFPAGGADGNKRYLVTVRATGQGGTSGSSSFTLTFRSGPSPSDETDAIMTSDDQGFLLTTTLSTSSHPSQGQMQIPTVVVKPDSGHTFTVGISAFAGGSDLLANGLATSASGQTDAETYVLVEYLDG